MIDLHSHALFGIDDGAQKIEDSLAILRRCERVGIKTTVVTPHFEIGEDVEEFLEKRNNRLEMLNDALKRENINVELVPGAEVYITDELFNESEIEKLTIGESNVVLAEFRYHSLRVRDFLGYIDELFSQGVRVLIAHPERYSYLREDGRLLQALIDADVMLQVNAISLFEDSEEGDFARMLVKNGFAFVIASDIHHESSRRLTAMDKLNQSGKWRKMLDENPRSILTK